MRTLGRRLVTLVSGVGARPGDPVELRMRKALLVLVALMVLPAAAVWGALYWLADERTAALLPWTFLVGSLASLAAFGLTGSYLLLRRSQLLLVLLIPFLLTISLGGLAASGGVILWSLLAPLGAITFDSPRRAWRWFVAYAILLAAAVPLSATVRPVAATLPDAMALAFLIMNVGAVSLIAFVLLATFARQREDAQQQADGLLLNILPAEIAELLKADAQQIAEQFDDASVLFADVVDFTPLSASLSPADVVSLLDRLFTDFDALVDRFGVEKIKTIGDAYMVASGVPRRRSDHAQVLAFMALEMQDVVGRHARDDGRALELRIGINSGPVVAGVIGRRKFIYDLWGDAVNTASRMESHGAPGQIQIGETTYELLKDDFECRARGPVEVKGKGVINTWYLLGPANGRIGRAPA
ncbi:MAG: adenylate/guanylate cyclase domain-containing protein [Chloroflexota bacterium]|jgi:adenylate cyclase|nr:adenylate/guanylate cyclase domain-containing protein [Chloroflexota bacterium]MDH5242642.1 adenylate/guanylate cyclase domain-containing protein [Chloroflexota bacterium]